MDTQLQKKQKELLDTLAAAVKNMVTTVNELTMQSAGSVSYAERKPIRFNILSAVQNTIEMYRLKPGANLDFIFSKRDYAEFEYQGDPVILKQILLDLFNSTGAGDSGRSIKVTITIRKEKEEEIESFIGFRIQTDTNRMLIDEAVNSGALATRLISEARGWFSQEAGDNYSVLTFTLPFTSSAAGGTPSTPAGKEIRTVNQGKELKEISILMVDDDLINQKITILTLKPLVKSIATAANGNEALNLLGSSEYDLILMDIQMPVMNGLTTSEKIREIESASGKHIPIIAITANAMIDDIEKCLAAGIDDYISKPCQPAALIGKIRNLIGAQPAS